jgi:hypothetical protein
MQAARQASLSPPLRNLEGDFVGTRVTGAKRTEQRVSIPKSRQKALDRDMKPPKDLSLPNIFDIGDFSKASDVEFLRKIARRSQGFGEAKLSMGENIGRGSQNEAWDDPLQFATGEATPLSDLAPQLSDLVNASGGNFRDVVEHALPDSVDVLQAEIAFLNESFERLGTRGSSSLFGANLDNERRAINRMLDDRGDRISEILDDEIPF